MSIKKTHRLKNVTKSTIISPNIVYIQGLTHKSIGLLGKRQGITLYFQTRFGIHTFFMKFPLDILITDNNYKVRQIKKNLKPNRIFVWNPRYKYVSEVTPGSIQKSKTTLGDTLEVS